MSKHIADTVIGLEMNVGKTFADLPEESKKKRNTP